MAEENKENEIVCIPGFHGRPPKEVSIKNLALVIQARVEEIFELVENHLLNCDLNEFRHSKAI